MKSHRRGRRAGLVIALGAVAALLAGCGQSGSTAASGGPVTITFLSYTVGQASAVGDGTKKLIADFEAANPEIKVEAQPVPTADVLTKLQASVVAGNPPDVAQIGWSKVAQAAGTLPLRPFEDITSAEDWKNTLDGIVPSVLKATPVAGQQKIVSMPFLMATPVLFYNTDLFKAAGLDPAHPPTTIDQMKQAALTIKAKTGADGTYVSAVDPGKSDYLTQSLVDSAGGGLVTPNGDITVDSPQAITALSAVQDLTKSGAQPAVQFDSAQSAFSAGKLGMLVTTAGGLVTLDKAAKGKYTLGVAPFPGFEGMPAHPTFSGNGLSILAKDSAKAQAAWKFVQFLTSEKSFEYIASSMGYLPLRAAAASAADPRLGPALQQLADLAPYTTFPGKKSNQGVVVLQDEAVEPIVLRGADPAATLHAAAAKIRSLG
ncbi:ABC transporter substrate-binding protein [Amycolatopsis sp. GM8]|uniref:ABC transporter substrate-binding protein n=1 Tax=Amycolatopsis sp. GM8 TaxID=2896530 RepID=UPI001F35B2D3|nr:ABC transporter substrate-binding protein [Amycolatopsis sp. GM8]